MFTNVSGVRAISACVAMAAILAPQIASASDANLCGFLRKVEIARKHEFEALKGDLLSNLGNEHNNVDFHGTLAPPNGGSCDVIIRRYLDKSKDEELPPSYDCTLSGGTGFSEAEQLYTTTAAAIKSCLPKWEYKEEKSGSQQARDEAWELTADGPGTELTLGFVDWGQLTQLTGGSSKISVAVQLNIDDKVPAPKGAPIPIMHTN